MMPRREEDEALINATVDFTSETFKELADLQEHRKILDEREQKLLEILDAVRPIHLMFDITTFNASYEYLYAQPIPKNKGVANRRKYAKRKPSEKPSRQELEGSKEADLLVRGEGEA